MMTAGLGWAGQIIIDFFIQIKKLHLNIVELSFDGLFARA